MLQADAAGSGRDEEEFERGELEGSEVGGTTELVKSLFPGCVNR